MKPRLLTSAVSSLSIISGAALAADLPVKGPYTAPIPAFTWSSCYAGASGGGGWARKDITDPIALAQDLLAGSPVTGGVTTAKLSPSGYLIGGQFGCDYQAAGSNWIIGFEGAFSGANIEDDRFFGLPSGNPGEQAHVSGRIDFITSGTARLGLTSDRWLLYVKGGVAGASDKYSVVGTFQGTPFNFQGVGLRVGWTAGGGLEWALFENWSVKLAYDFYDFGTKTVSMNDNNLELSGPVRVKQTVQAVTLGLNFHMWSSDK
jgi:outer membrane immunogenic protein